jgi:hypothetical protein
VRVGIGEKAREIGGAEPRRSRRLAACRSSPCPQPGLLPGPNGGEYPSVTTYQDINDSTVLNQVYSLVQQLASDYGTSRNPFKLYAIGFGPVFTGADASSALSTLQTMQYYGGTQSSASTALPSSQIITGTDAQMSTNMSTAFTTILESGIQIALTQ